MIKIFVKVPHHVATAVDQIRSSDSILVVTHHDADGASSAGSLARAFERLGKEYRVITVRQLYPDVLEDLPLTDYDFTLFTDLGGKYIDAIARYTDRFLVVDHHDVDVENKRLFHPLQMGYDPDSEASASTISSILSFHLSEDYKTLAYGLLGAVGDRQLRGTFKGLNRVLMVRTMKAGIITIYRDLVLPGIDVRDLPWVLLYADPPLPGLTGDEESIYDFIQGAGIETTTGRIKYAELPLDLKRRFVTNLVLHLLRYGWSVEDVRGLIGEVYEINGNVGWKSRIRSMSSLVDAVAKLLETDTYIRLLLDDPAALQDAEDLLIKYRQTIVNAIRIGRERYEDMGSFVFLDARPFAPPYSSGALASIISSESGKPALVIVEGGDGYIKASLRGGSNLSAIVERILEVVEGEGGGHKEAAGFRIAEDDLERVIEILSSIPSEDF